MLQPAPVLLFINSCIMYTLYNCTLQTSIIKLIISLMRMSARKDGFIYLFTVVISVGAVVLSKNPPYIKGH